MGLILARDFLHSTLMNTQGCRPADGLQLLRTEVGFVNSKQWVFLEQQTEFGHQLFVKAHFYKCVPMFYSLRGKRGLTGKPCVHE